MIELKAYQGLIRNHADLAKQLDLDLSQRSRREREEAIVVAAYQKWGDEMGLHINGQFGIVLFDTETEELFCTRDVLGAELLFYYQTEDGRLLTALQIRDLFDQPGFKRQLNEELIQFYLGFSYIPGEETLFKGVYKLEPGGTLRFGKKGLTLGRFWEKGPQKRLYIPAPLLREGENQLLILETEGRSGEVWLHDEPDLV